MVRCILVEGLPVNPVSTVLDAPGPSVMVWWITEESIVGVFLLDLALSMFKNLNALVLVAGLRVFLSCTP